jgi:hypothetical protein
MIIVVDCWMDSCKLTEMAAAKESGQSLGIPQMAIAPYTYHQIAQDTSKIFYLLNLKIYCLIPFNVDNLSDY